jgi:hypothetical protein
MELFFLCRSCRKNDPIYQAIQGYNKWDLTTKFSVKDVRAFSATIHAGLMKHVPKLASFCLVYIFVPVSKIYNFTMCLQKYIIF